LTVNSKNFSYSIKVHEVGQESNVSTGASWFHVSHGSYFFFYPLKNYVWAVFGVLFTEVASSILSYELLCVTCVVVCYLKISIPLFSLFMVSFQLSRH
jgi:hypothetical protein